MNKILFIEFITRLLILCLTLISQVKCYPPVTGKCGIPGVPPKANKWLISSERSRFNHKEKVIIMCDKKEFPLYKHEIECNNGRWIGKHARCGQNMEAQVNHLEILNCQSPINQLLVSQPINQSAEGPSDLGPLPHNAFHSIRVSEDLNISANNSNCYTFRVGFDRKVQIWFLTIDIWVQKNQSNIVPELTPFVNKYRTCELRKNTIHHMSSDTIFGFYFICDLHSDSDFKKEESEMSSLITFNIKTNFSEEIGLEAIFIGNIFTRNIGPKIVGPECGQYQIQNLGVDAQEEVGHTFISCNDSFVDLNGQNITQFATNGNPKHKFICNWNGEWVGEWPVCMPKNTCPTDDIMSEKHSSVSIEEIGNVYYLNESQWFAINQSYIRYVCVNENIMIGKDVRTCLKNGFWSSKAPYCSTTGISSLGIAGILFTVLVVFVLIVLFVFRTHSKRVNRELRETRNEMQGSQRKRYSDEFYSDVKESVYDSSGMRKSCVEYESVDYEDCDQPRYQMELHPNKVTPEYLDLSNI